MENEAAISENSAEIQGETSRERWFQSPPMPSVDGTGWQQFDFQNDLYGNWSALV